MSLYDLLLHMDKLYRTHFSGTPHLKLRSMTDLQALGALRIAHGRCIAIVDSTLASPYHQQVSVG